MSYEYKRSKKDKASIIPIEETYTNYDINNNDENIPSIGYRFDAPRRWTTSRYQTKSIGIRDLQLRVPNVNFTCRFVCYFKAAIPLYPIEWVDAVEEEDGDTIPGHYNIDKEHPDLTSLIVHSHAYVSSIFAIKATSSNNFEEVFWDFFNNVNKAGWRNIRGNSGSYTYNSVLIPIDLGHCYVKDKPVPDISNPEEEEEEDNAEIKYVDDYIKTEVSNRHATDIPILFTYDYDGTIGNLQISNEDIILGVKMDEDGDFEQRFTDLYFEVDNLTYKPIDEIEAAEEDLDTITHCYENYAIPVQRTLLLIVEQNEKEVEDCYKLFNQPLPKKLSKNTYENLATITINGKTYYVPFVNKFSDNGTNIFLNHNGDVFNSNISLTSIGSTLSSVPLTTNDNILHSNLNLSNVWDRTSLYYHASFVDTRHKIIGRNGDHWDTPNKQFIVPTGDQDQFYIWFTTDTRHRILPNGCTFNIDLTFMLNPTNNTATRNHDSFKD